MKAKGLSASLLNNRVKMWALHCAKDPNYTWTKHDANALLLIEEAVRYMRHDKYLSRKALKANPYLSPKTPYHTV